MSDMEDKDIENAAEIAEAMRCAAFRKAEELGVENVLFCMMEALDMLTDATKKFIVLRLVLGPEKMSEIGNMLARIESEKVVKEAEEMLRGEFDDE